MPMPEGRRAAVAAAVAMFAAALVDSALTSPSHAARTEVREGVTHVLNPPAPESPPEAVATVEAWRAGGEDDEDIIFGVLSSIDADASGTLYLLDSQLSEVFVFSPEGEYLRSIGREGEGPGEFRRASDLFVMPNGDIAVMQGMPGKIVLLTPDGEPTGDVSLPESMSGGPVHFTGGGVAGDALILGARQFRRNDEGFEVTRSLVRISEGGTITATYFEKSDRRNMANLTFNEKKDAEAIWTSDAAGRVYLNDNFDAYQIKVYGTDGKLARVIEREYEHRKRSAAEKERNRPRMIVRRGNRQVEADAVVSDTDRDIAQIFARDDGTLWVVSSRGAADTPDDVIAEFDVFDADGNFTRQVSISGEGDFGSDGLHFVGDRLFVVRGLESAQRAMFGGDDEASDEDLEEAAPMAVICYELGGIVKAAR